jgi:hypothetical protein
MLRKGIILKLSFLILFQIAFFADKAIADYIFCNKGNAYTGDSEAEVAMKCGPPMQIIRADPIKVEEKIGNKTITRWIFQYIYVYPASKGYFYYLKFENHKLMSIDIGYPGQIPK